MFFYGCHFEPPIDLLRNHMESLRPVALHGSDGAVAQSAQRVDAMFLLRPKDIANGLCSLCPSRVAIGRVVSARD